MRRAVPAAPGAQAVLGVLGVLAVLAVLALGVLAVPVAVPGVPLARPAPAAAAPASPEERAAAITRPAVAFVRVRWHGWVRDTRSGEVFGGTRGYQVTASCSGAVVAGEGYLVTAGHCVDPGPEGAGGLLVDQAVADLAEVGRARDTTLAARALAARASVEGPTPNSPILRTIEVERSVAKSGRPNREVLPATVVDFLPISDGDVAVLKVSGHLLPSIELAADEVPVGTPILAVGYPASADRASDPTLEPSNKDGKVSTLRKVDGVPFYEISAAASRGMSGGPVVDMQGRLVGVISASPAGETQAFNLVAASSTLADTLRDNGVTTALSAVDRNWRAGLDHFFAGRYGDAVTFFDAVLDGVPNHQQATEYRGLALERGGDRRGGGDLLLVAAALLAGVAVLSASGAGALVLVGRRSRRTVRPAAPAAAAGSAGPAGTAGTVGTVGTAGAAGAAVTLWERPAAPAPPWTPPVPLRTCPRCAEHCAPDRSLCPRCGCPLN